MTNEADIAVSGGGSFSNIAVLRLMTKLGISYRTLMTTHGILSRRSHRSEVKVVFCLSS